MPYCECGFRARDGSQLRDHRRENHPEGYQEGDL